MKTKGSVTLNRRLKASWLIEALRLRAEGSSPEEARARLEAMLSEDIGGKESVRKSLRYLRQVWLEPHPVYGKLQAEGVDLYRQQPTVERARFLSFFMLLAIYPFAREVAEACGQLFRLQGTIKAEQIKRKIIAKRGQRESILRSTRYAISIFSDLGILRRSGTRGTYAIGKLSISESSLSAYSLEAIFESVGKSQISRSDLNIHPALFAFDSQWIITSAISDPRFNLSKQSLSREYVDLLKQRIPINLSPEVDFHRLDS